MVELSESFLRDKYVVVEKLVDPEICKFISNHMILKNIVHPAKSDEQCNISPSFYGLETTETLLVLVNPFYTELAGRHLMPTYSYSRIYNQNEILDIHTDRKECDYSVTICLGKPDSSVNDPFYISYSEDKSDAREINLNIGDAVFYRGCDVFHWRDRINSEWMTQTFLHYVENIESNVKFLYDGRESLMVPKYK